MSRSSRIFSSNRALGYVSNHVPLVTRYINRRGENLIVTCVGRSFHTYGCSHFSLLSVSDILPDDISCLAADVYHVYTASGTDVHAWRRGTELKHTYKGHTSNVHILLPFGPHLLSVDESSKLIVWDIKAEEMYLKLEFNNDLFQITALIHPHTYINKALFGSEQGQLQLWNIKTSKLIYTFTGWNSSVTALEQAPAVDVVGIGLANGRIVLHNLKFDETVMTFNQDWGAVISISFRLDGTPVMTTGSSSGHIVLWDLEKRLVVSQLLHAHNGAVTGMKCLPSEPLMVTSSPDNSLKLWIFDLSDGSARLLRLREGHAGPPTWIRFHGSDGHNILSAGGDSSMRIFNTISETFNKSMGRASYNRKLSKKTKSKDKLIMPPVTHFVSEVTRDKEWDSIAAVHRNLLTVTTWSYDKVKMGDHKLALKKFKEISRNSYSRPTATCISMTNCGNFVLIGYSTGHVERYNMQSGLHRCSYGVGQAHDAAVRGVAADNLNQFVITGGADGSVKFWYFKEPDSEPIGKITLLEPVNFFHQHRESSILCICLEDFTISLLDLDTRRIIRKFIGHTSAITDAAFSPDARWLVTASVDHTIRTWDIPSGQHIDCFQVPTICTSLSFSPTGEFLATAHVDYLGIYLWSNRTLFSHVSLKPLPVGADVPLVDLPCGGRAESEDNVNDEESTEFDSLEQIDKDLITLSGLASSRWQNLLDIDLIKKRNKPKEPPKNPKAAPFFLPTVPSLNFQFDFSNVERTDDSVKTIRLSSFENNYTIFGKMLDQCGSCDNFDAVIEKLKTMGPSAVDFEINSLSVEGGGSISLMLYFMKMISCMLKSNKNFELGQAYLALFLKVHSETVALTPKLNSFVSELQNSQESGWSKLQDQFMYCLSVIDTLKTS